MITVALGNITGPLPVPTGNYAFQSRFLGEIIFAPDPTSTGIVYVAHNGFRIVAFNKANPAGGDLGGPFKVQCPGEADIIDPTEYSILPTVAGEGLFVTYVVE